MGSVLKDFGIFFLLLIGLFIAWVFTGGPDRYTQQTSATRIGYGSVPTVSMRYSSISTESEQLNGTETVNKEDSTMRVANIEISSRGNARRESNPDKEYIVIRNRGSAPATITGWSVMNNRNDPIADGVRARSVLDTQRLFIDEGAILPVISRRNATAPIVLMPKEEAIIVTGKSPNTFPALLNTSFKENVCSGYFADAHDFRPRMRESCPDPDKHPRATGFDRECRDFVERMFRCDTPDFDSIAHLTNQCRAFITETFDYPGCVATYQFSDDFYTDRWRIYLEHTRELWSGDRDVITLLDETGAIVDQLIYD